MKQFLKILDNGTYKRIPHAWINGDHIADLLLEDVFFKITIKGDDFEAEVDPDAADYFSSLNQQKFIADICDYCRDEAESFASKPNISLDDVVLYDDQLPPLRQGFDAIPVIID